MAMKPELTPNSSQEMDSGWYHLSSIHTETKAATILENVPWEAQLALSTWSTWGRGGIVVVRSTVPQEAAE